jgi:DNA topoisomerase III
MFRFMKYIQQKPSRLHCSHCDETYALPIGGTIKLARELKCPLDDFEILSWSSGSKGRSFPFCPYCYNNPPFNDMARNSGCNNCSHPTCQHSLTNLGVSSCIECEKGVLVLDCTFSPKNWKLGCNCCDCIINIFDDATKVKFKNY